MAGRYLLDTNIVIGLWAGDGDIRTRLDAAPSVFLSSIVLGELHFGAAKSARRQQNAGRIEDFAATCTLLGIDADTAQIYGAIKANLERQGQPIPENDLWIAACARQHDLVLVSRDRHFESIQGFGLEAW